MMKSSQPVIMVDSVEKAVKFYTEKLAFDIVGLMENKEGTEKALVYAQLRKGKCFIMFRTPHVEELAEFSFIKRCASRCVGVYVEMKKGLEKYHQRCSRKGVQIIEDLKDQPWGEKSFSIKDPFGIKLTFAQSIKGFVPAYKEFLGLAISETDASGQTKNEDVLLEEMVQWLKKFGILRRSSKKYGKLWLKNKRQ